LTLFEAATSANVTWHSGLTRWERSACLSRPGITVWFTGLPASGKSTVAAALEHELVSRGRAAYLLDGDNLRHGLNGDLAFDRESRAENVRRSAHVARLFADAGVVALVSLVSPYASERAKARELHEADGIPFLEVYVNTPLTECERRDPKGLYARARRGEIRDFTGVHDPYEPPECADVELRGGDQPLEAAMGLVLERLEFAAEAASRAATAAGLRPM
jgi:adenylyl-sulfate kinase